MHFEGETGNQNINFEEHVNSHQVMESRDSAVVSASHQCGLDSIPGCGVICGLSLLLVLYSAARGFSPGTPVFPLLKSQHFQIPIRSWNAQTFLNEFLRTPRCSVGKQVTFTFFFM